MNRRTLISSACIVVITLFATACATSQLKSGVQAETDLLDAHGAVQGKVTIADNASGMAEVVVTTNDTTGDRPSHIHTSTCNSNGPVKYPLSDVVNGKSDSVLPVSTAALLKGPDQFYVNVHESAQAIDNILECAQLHNL